MEHQRRVPRAGELGLGMTGLGKLGMGMIARRASIWLAVALVVGVTLGSTSFVRAQPLLREAPPEIEFFRFTARYTVKATGEVIQFDLVRPCWSVTVRDMYGDKVWAPPIPIQWGSYFSQVKYFPKDTK